MLSELTVKEFLGKTYGSDPVPGGGSVSALNGALAAALGAMVAGLTIGKKKYIEVEEEMKAITETLVPVVNDLMADIDRDSDAYNEVFGCFKLPKETEGEKAARKKAIEKATRHAAEVPLSVAKKTCAILPLLEDLVEHGNHNAVTDACVAAMCARTAVLGAVLNVRINLSGIADEDFVAKIQAECDKLTSEAISGEKIVLEAANKYI